MTARIHAVLRVFRASFENGMLVRTGFAYALFATAELGMWISLLVYAYGHGRAPATTLMMVVQSVPCVVVGPMLGAYADRHVPSRVLCVTYAVQSATMAAIAVAVASGGPAPLVFALAPLTSLSISMTRPAQAALLPGIVRTPDELTAANVMSGWTYAAAALVGPAVAGAVLRARGAGLAFAVMATMASVSMVLVLGLTRDRHVLSNRRDPGGGQDPAGAAASLGASESELVADLRAARANLAHLGQNPAVLVVLTLYEFSFLLLGALDLLYVVLAIQYLHLGSGGAGFLNAAFGAGALLAGVPTSMLVGRRRVAPVFVSSLGVAVLALAAVDATTSILPVLLLLCAVGLASSVVDVTGRTLLYRSVPPDAIGGLFSILESLSDLGLVLGAIVVQIGLAVGGPRAALAAPGVLTVVLVAALWRKLRTVDSSVVVPQVEVRLLRSNPIFAALPPPELESVARELEPVTAGRGTRVCSEGDPGDRYYAVADGTLEVTRQGVRVNSLGRGEGFGEIALIRDVPRQATVTAQTDVSLYALHKSAFLQAVTGHATATSAAERIVSGYAEGDVRRGTAPEPTD